jgi:hypothetical protein
VLESLARLAQDLAQSKPSGGGDPSRDRSGDPADLLDGLLGPTRRWCGAFGLEVTPRRWRFAEPMELANLQPDERARPMFASAPPGRAYRVHKFSLSGTGADTPCVVLVSAGLPPSQYQHLLKLAEEAGEVGRPLHAQLNGWAEAQLTGHLQTTAERFFVSFYDGHYQQFHEVDPDAADHFRNLLLDLLKKQFGLTTFEPTTLTEYDRSWVQSTTGTGYYQSGRVKHVMRPGLKDRQGLLRAAAVVEAE